MYCYISVHRVYVFIVRLHAYFYACTQTRTNAHVWIFYLTCWIKVLIFCEEILECLFCNNVEILHVWLCILTHMEVIIVELLSGDAYRYTIQPDFRDMKQRFQCLIRLQPRKLLYRLFYSLKLPGTSFETLPVTVSVHASTTNLTFQSQGTFLADYITVEHNTGFHLHNEFVIIGRESTFAGATNYTINPLKTDGDFKEKPITLRKISHNVLIASTQFRRPFDYSTMNWVRDNDCDKDMSRFVHVQKHYKPEAAQSVDVILHKTAGSFKYFLKSVDSPPYLRFTAPGVYSTYCVHSFYLLFVVTLVAGEMYRVKHALF